MKSFFKFKQDRTRFIFLYLSRNVSILNAVSVKKRSEIRKFAQLGRDTTVESVVPFSMSARKHGSVQDWFASSIKLAFSILFRM